MLMNDCTTLLLTDLYQLNMIKAYLDHGHTRTAVFEFFVRKLPSRRGFLLAAGLEQALDFFEGFRFSAEEIDWLERTGPACHSSPTRGATRGNAAYQHLALPISDCIKSGADGTGGAWQAAG